MPLQTRQLQSELMPLQTRRLQSELLPAQTQQVQSELMSLQARQLRLELMPLQAWQWQSELVPAQTQQVQSEDAASATADTTCGSEPLRRPRLRAGTAQGARSGAPNASHAGMGRLASYAAATSTACGSEPLCRPLWRKRWSGAWAPLKQAAPPGSRRRTRPVDTSLVARVTGVLGWQARE